MIGAAAVVSACFFAALSRLRAKRERIALLFCLRDSIEVLQRELAERRVGMREIFSQLARRSRSEEAVSFYELLSGEMDKLGERSFSTIWDGALHSAFSRQGEELVEILSPLGICLGGSEIEPQLAALQNAARQLQRTAETERAALSGEKRLSFGLSLSVGAMIVIMLL